MRDILQDVDRWLAEGKSVALASVITTWGSAPRSAGSKMAVSEAGEMVGSVSAGCVESSVVEEALDVLRLGKPRRLHYGVSDETAWEVGLACGGKIDLFVEPLAPLLARHGSGTGSPYQALRAAAREERPAVRAVVIDGPEGAAGAFLLATSPTEMIGTLPAPLTDLIRQDVLSMLGGSQSDVRVVRERQSQYTVFFDVQLPSPRLVIVGGVHIAVELTALAKRMGYEVIIVDPRKAFATGERFPEADRLIHEWPDAGLRTAGLTASTAVAVLSHDPKLDDPALLEAVRSPAFYVGALGSQRTQKLRRERLAEAGLSDAEIARIHGPIGLDLGGREPVEVALSILAEIVAVRAGRTEARA